MSFSISTVKDGKCASVTIQYMDINGFFIKPDIDAIIGVNIDDIMGQIGWASDNCCISWSDTSINISAYGECRINTNIYYPSEATFASFRAVLKHWQDFALNVFGISGRASLQ
jgi:hypothetical protein